MNLHTHWYVPPVLKSGKIFFVNQVIVFLSMVCYVSAVPDCDTVIHIYVAYTGDRLDAFKFSDLTFCQW